MWNATVVLGDVRSETQGVTTTSGEAVMLGPFSLGRRPTKSFTVCNYGPGSLAAARVEVNPDIGGDEVGASPDRAVGGSPVRRQPPNPTLWHAYDSTAFSTMASGEVRSLVANDLFRWWRIVAVNTVAAPITVSGWCHASTF